MFVERGIGAARRSALDVSADHYSIG